MQRYWNYATDHVAAVATPAPGCTITVYNAGTVTLSTIYADAGGTPLANPFTASMDSYFAFYAAAGRYDVHFTGTGITTPFTWSDILLLESTGASYLNTANTYTALNTFAAGLNISAGQTLNYNGSPVLVAGKLPALTGAYLGSVNAGNLTGLNATEISTGTLPSGRLLGTYSGALVLTNITNQIYAANIYAGVSAASTGVLNLPTNSPLYGASVDPSGADVWLIKSNAIDHVELNTVDTHDIAPLVTDTYSHGAVAARYLKSYFATGYADTLVVGTGAHAAVGALRLGAGTTTGISFRSALAAVDLSFYLDTTDQFFFNSTITSHNIALQPTYKYGIYNTAGAAVVNILSIDASDRIVLGDGTADIVIKKAVIALGGGAAITAGTAGGSGPAGAAQSGWYKFINSAGDATFVPFWK